MAKTVSSVFIHFSSSYFLSYCLHSSCLSSSCLAFRLTPSPFSSPVSPLAAWFLQRGSSLVLDSLCFLLLSLLLLPLTLTASPLTHSPLTCHASGLLFPFLLVTYFPCPRFVEILLFTLLSFVSSSLLVSERLSLYLPSSYSSFVVKSLGVSFISSHVILFWCLYCVLPFLSSPVCPQVISSLTACFSFLSSSLVFSYHLKVTSIVALPPFILPVATPSYLSVP